MGLESKPQGIGNPPDVTASPLYYSITQLRMAIARSKKEQKELEDLTSQLNDQYVVSRRREFNDRFLMTKNAFSHSNGLPRRPWYKHLIYNPMSDVALLGACGAHSVVFVLGGSGGRGLDDLYIQGSPSTDLLIFRL